MSSLTTYRMTPEYENNKFVTLTAGATIQQGSMVAVNASGVAVPASVTSGLKVVGRAENHAASGEKVKIRMGVFGWDNDSTNAVTAADFGKNAYVVDDHTVTATAATGENAVNIVAGVVKGIDDEGLVIVAPAPLTAVGLA